jgi:hypothetical protein
MLRCVVWETMEEYNWVEVIIFAECETLKKVYFDMLCMSHSYSLSESHQEFSTNCSPVFLFVNSFKRDFRTKRCLVSL